MKEAKLSKDEEEEFLFSILLQEEEEKAWRLLFACWRQ
jgi:hypothetical protein